MVLLHHLKSCVIAQAFLFQPFSMLSISSPLLFYCFLLLQQDTALPCCCSNITNPVVLAFFFLTISASRVFRVSGLSDGSIEEGKYPVLVTLEKKLKI